ncbi:hypothetical protein RJ639_013667 [Escallonia herrerae]|uniref:Integrase catalytic domain-containing protein n=1 Tax=Escallonia herrerae TaxID=1293975 RepID=A0AA88VLQ0_9ASTE|nr:hypothetical protein RJ639_013667 [Escallonia herrerae]
MAVAPQSTHNSHLDPTDLRFCLTSRSSYGRKYRSAIDPTFNPKEKGEHMTRSGSCYHRDPTAEDSTNSSPRTGRQNLQAVVSTYHLKIKFPPKHGIEEVKGGQNTALQCFMASCPSKNKEALVIEDLREDTNMQRGEPIEDLISIEVYPGEENKTVRIGSNIKEDTKLELVNLLRTYADVFAWTAEDMPGIDPDTIVRKSFEELKTYLSSPHLLSKPLSREDLFLYLSVNEVAVSAVLVREEDGVQKPIYYVSKVLQDVETRYPKIDMIALALIISARCLRPNFQSHTIVVLTDQPLRKVLLSPEASGRFVNWLVKLGKFNIQYKPRTAIKAQALADFIVECTLLKDPPQLVISEVPNPWNLYVNSSSAIGSSGARIILINLEGFIVEYTLRFGFQASNNEAEYEALLAGIRLAHALKFKNFTIRRIPRDQNTQIDTLSRLASAKVTDVRRSVYPEFLKDRSISSHTEIGMIDQEPCWMDMIIKYLSTGKLPSERHEARNLRVKAARYTLVEGVLYKKSFNLPYLRCLRPSESLYALQEVHEGICGQHLGGRTLAQKILRQRYYWPTIQKDAIKFTQRCNKCQKFALVTHTPVAPLTSVVSLIPFAIWEMDLLGPFPMASGHWQFVIVAINYFTKWTEAKSLATITSAKCEDFFWKNVICRFGVPRALVVNNRKQFDNNNF